MTLVPVSKRLAVELSLPVLNADACRCWDSKTQSSACEASALTDCATVAARK